MVEFRTLGSRLADALNYGLLALLAATMLYPFHLLNLRLRGQLLDDGGHAAGRRHPLAQDLVDRRLRLRAEQPVMLRVLGVSGFLATVGTAVNLAFTTSSDYALANRHLRARRIFQILVLISLLFGPGLIPKFLMVKETGLINSIWALILPTVVSAFYLIIMRNFFMKLLRDLYDAAEVDGANVLQVL